MRRLVALMVAMLVVAACQVDVVVTVSMDEDGTGTVTVEATADADVLEEAPDLADELELGDALSAGWEVNGPTETGDGGLGIRLTHEFARADELGALLSSLGGPFAGVEVTRTIEGSGDDASATNVLDGAVVLQDGFAGFADEPLLDTVGGVPFEDRLADHTPEETMSIVLAVRLPGDIEATNGDRDGDVVRWDMPLDGSIATVELVTTQTPGSGASWASPLATGALIALVVWLAVATWLVLYLTRNRRS